MVVIVVALGACWRLLRRRRPHWNVPNDVRIQALATRGDIRARRINTVEQPREFLGPLTTARIFAEAVVVAVFAYLGARAYGPFEGAVGFGLIGGLVIALIQMTVRAHRRSAAGIRSAAAQRCRPDRGNRVHGAGVRAGAARACGRAVVGRGLRRNLVRTSCRSWSGRKRPGA